MNDCGTAILISAAKGCSWHMPLATRLCLREILTWEVNNGQPGKVALSQPVLPLVSWLEGKLCIGTLFSTSCV